MAIKSTKIFPAALTTTAALLTASYAHAALTISNHATQNVTCSQGVCSATAGDAVLNVTDLTNLLASGNMTIQSGGQAQDIEIDAPFSWASSSSLTLDAYRGLTVKQPVSDAGTGALTLATSDGGKSGDLLFLGQGSVGFLSTSNALTINGKSYTLVNGLPSLIAAVLQKRSSFFALTNSYDASADGLYRASPVKTTFAGTFQGLGNTIANLQLSPVGKKNTNVGLFALIDTGGAVASVRLMNVNINAKPGSAIGAIAGVSYGSIFNVSASGVINTVAGTKSETVVGGSVGSNVGIVDASISSVDINIVGKSQIAIATAGNLAGINDGNIKSSFAIGVVSITGTAASSPAGGLVGFNDGALKDCYSTGSVTTVGQSSAGGGLVGQGRLSITSSYSTSFVSGSAGDYVGGFIGYDEGASFSNAYWDLGTSGISDPSQGAGNIPNDPGITGLTDDQLKSGLPKGFDKKVWAQSKKINNGYPYLIANPPPK